MTTPRWRYVAAIFAGGCLGTVLRACLVEAFHEHQLGLAVANFIGCFALGLTAGYFGDKTTLLRVFLAVGLIASFTSWSSLALYAVHGFGGVLAAVAETLVGIVVAGLAHELGRRWSA